MIDQGQSPYQIAANHPELDMSVRSLYTYLDKGLFSARNIDLKRKPGFRPRKCHKTAKVKENFRFGAAKSSYRAHKTQITDRAVFIGRTYADFQQLELSSFTEMDTVHSSRESGKTPLTFFFTKEKLFLVFLMNRCTKGAVRLVFDRLEERLGTYDCAR